MTRHKSKRQVEEIVARLRPQAPVSASVRRLPAARLTPASAQAPPQPAANLRAADDAQGDASQDLLSPGLAPAVARPVVVPLAPQRYRVQFTASAETYEKLRLAQALLRHQISDGDLGKIFDRALTALLEDVTRRKLAATDRPREPRHCPGLASHPRGG